MKYNNEEFRNKILSTTNNSLMHICPCCGNNKFTTPEDYAYIIAARDKNINLQNSIPCGIVVCDKCGHVELYALGVLNMLNEDEKK